MNDPSASIRSDLFALVRRARRQVGAVALADTALLIGAGAVLAAIGPLVGLGPRIWASVSAAAVAVAWVARLPAVRAAWTEASDALVQARRVEAVLPTLRGRLLALASPWSDAGASSVLMSRIARGVAAQGPWVPGDVLPNGGVLRRLVLAGGAWMAVGIALLGVGPDRVARFYGASQLANWLKAGVADGRVPVGDIAIDIVPPAYTGLEPSRLENATGQVLALPGSQVTVSVRTPRPVDRATMFLGEMGLATAVAEGRNATASFTMPPEATTWDLRWVLAGLEERSESHPVLPTLDRAPEVRVDVPRREIEVPADAPLGVAWSAVDDFGVDRVGFELSGRPIGREARAGDRRRPEWSDVVGDRPMDWGLSPGDVAEFVVVAWDNDAVSGAKAGRSLAIRLVVTGPGAAPRIGRLRERRLMELAIPVLAEGLLETWPPGRRSSDFAVWGERLAQRYERLFAWFSEVGEEAVYDLPLAAAVLRTARNAVRASQVNFSPDDGGPPPPDAVTELARLRSEAEVALEDVLLMVELSARSRAFAEVVRRARELAEVSDPLAKFAKDPGAPSTALDEALSLASRDVARVRRSSSELEPGGFAALVENRLTELDAMIRRLEGMSADPAAREAAGRLAERVTDLAASIDAELARRQEDAEDLAQETESVIEALRALAEDERELRAEVEGMRQAADRPGAALTEAAWERAAEALVGASTAGERAAAQASKGRMYVAERTNEARDRLDRLERAVEMRDVGGAWGSLDLARLMWTMAGRASAMSGGSSADATAVLRGLDEAADALEEVSRLAEQRAVPGATDLVLPQQGLAAQLRGAASAAQEAAARLPVAPQGMTPALAEARDEMARAIAALQEARPMEAEGAQGVAALRTDDAADALERALAASSRVASAMDPERGEGGEDGSEGGELDEPPEPIELPDPEEFVTPEAYRQALLEGMTQDVPPAWREARRRYYETLVSP